MGEALMLVGVIAVLIIPGTIITGWIHGFPVLQWMGLRKPSQASSDTPPSTRAEKLNE